MKVIFEPNTLKLDTTGTFCLACNSRIQREVKDQFEINRCTTCANPSCKVCLRPLQGEDRKKLDRVCTGCFEYRTKQEFNQAWASKTVAEKLACHGLPKLKSLAKKKAIKVFSTMSKKELINSLLPVTTNSDFPIA